MKEPKLEPTPNAIVVQERISEIKRETGIQVSHIISFRSFSQRFSEYKELKERTEEHEQEGTLTHMDLLIGQELDMIKEAVSREYHPIHTDMLKIYVRFAKKL